jgi:hypothetical protein
MMTKHSKLERERRAAESERMVEIGRAWTASIPAGVAADFAKEVAVAQTRVYEKPADMAPGTLPNPPRPGREPKPTREENPRGRR